MKRSVNGIEYESADPTGNITALVRTRVSDSEYSRTARMILDDDGECEQVGFLLPDDTCDIGLHMAAGEFCGNATMSAAAVYAMDKGLPVNDKIKVTVSSSGCDDPVSVDITRLVDNDHRRVYGGVVDMPLPAKITRSTFEYNGRTYDLPIVCFAGISHIIAYNEDLGLTDDMLEEAIRKWCDELGASGLGIMTVNGLHNFEMRPLVYVPEVGSCFWESSCASGTTAFAAYLFEEGGRKELDIVATEPGGVLTAKVQKNGHILLGGTVRI